MVNWHTKSVALTGGRMRVAVLTAESGKYIYDYYILSDGRTEFQVNGKVTTGVPNSPLARAVAEAGVEFKDRIVAYLGLDPASTEGKAAWWAITDGLKAIAA